MANKDFQLRRSVGKSGMSWGRSYARTCEDSYGMSLPFRSQSLGAEPHKIFETDVVRMRL